MITPQYTVEVCITLLAAFVRLFYSYNEQVLSIMYMIFCVQMRDTISMEMVCPLAHNFFISLSIS